MTTWTGYPSTGSAVTHWYYDTKRGWLTNKVYADFNGPTYAYTKAGRPLTRTWSRGSPKITVTYGYTAAGDLAAISYNDGVTSGVTNTYDRRGRLATVLENSITTTLTLNDASETLVETNSGGVLSGLSITNAYDSILRRTGLGAVGYSASQTAFTYNNSDRLATVGDGTYFARYGYLANSPLVGQITNTQYSTQRMLTTEQYDFLNRLNSISSAPSGSGQNPVVFAYTYNTANQRTRAALNDLSAWSYQYDALGQVTSGKRAWGDGTMVPGEQFQYSFDTIGNRVSTQAGGDQNGGSLRSATYTANNLNEYSSRTVPGAADIIGAADVNGTVTVNGHSTYRHGQYYQTALTLTNSSGAVWQSVTNSVVDGATNNAVTGNVFLPPSTETFTFDLDGNLTSDGRWTNTWDAENRLVSMQALSGLPSGAKKQLNFVYDWRGRRVQKIVSTWSGSAYVAQSTNRFLYDGWNLLAELNGANNSLIRSYIWGTDLSGSMQGAAGVGGLIAVKPSGSDVLFAAYDGNGNVSALVDATTAANVAQYAYGPFGELLQISPTGTNNLSPMRFNTAYTDDESDLVAFGRRPYNPLTGRWLTREPLGEKEAPNLCALECNDPIDHFDVLGLYQAGGHFYTVYAVAIAKGYSSDDAYQLAYYSQLPDQVGQYSAYDSMGSWAYERAFQNQWLQDVQEVLHSLHGGDVDKRRACLRKMMADPSLNLIDRGLLSHTFGDAYAHTYVDPTTGQLKAYDYPYGHANTPFGGNAPDLPSLRPDVYQDYVNNLFQSIPAGPLAQNPDLVNNIIQENQTLSKRSNPFVAQNILISFIINKAGYSHAYRPERGGFQSNPPSGGDDLGTLNQSRIQQLIDRIKRKCCSK
jgi:RHS repeat-associated protein